VRPATTGAVAAAAMILLLAVFAAVFARGAVANRHAARAALGPVSRAEVVLEARVLRAAAEIDRLTRAAPRPTAVDTAAWELTSRARELGARVERVDVDTTAPEVSMTVTAPATALAGLLLVLDRVIADANLAVRELAITTSAEPEVRLDVLLGDRLDVLLGDRLDVLLGDRLDVGLRPAPTGVGPPASREPDAAAIAHAFRGEPGPGTPTAPGSATDRVDAAGPADARGAERTRRATGIRWVGTISSEHRDRFVLVVAGKGVAVLAPGDPAWFGWSVVRAEDDLLVVQHEGVMYEVRR